uniref:Ribosomal protein L10e/L16 domain-containing protein n=1 Tax=Panagrolaimus davidi TaxID=227884 RepID=A0A914P846_9BILA
MLSCAGTDRLQTGMRGAYGKPQDLVARVELNDVLMSMRVRDQNEAHALKAFRCAKFKFLGRQFVITSRKCGFTAFDREQYTKLRGENLLRKDGANVKLVGPHGLLLGTI